MLSELLQRLPVILCKVRDSNKTALLAWGSCAGLASITLCAAFFRFAVERIIGSVQLMPPTLQQLKEESLDANPLYRLIPAIRGKFAWRSLGKFPTPVHRFECPLGPKSERPSTENQVEFWVKREDLSSEKYGGNKVRSLQYSLACFEAYAHDCNTNACQGVPRLLTMGSAGSNQVVATKVHAAAMGLPDGCMESYCPMPDEPETDNTLNYLSALSLPGTHGRFGSGWLQIFAAALLKGSHRKGVSTGNNSHEAGARASSWVLPPGGNNVAGILGQAGAAIELAEQIVRGELPDPDGIVVALGSTCTTTGLVLGVALARHLGMPAFQKPGFRIYAQPVHPGFAYLQRFFGSLRSEGLPMMIGCGLRDAAAAIAKHGGPDATAEALAVMRDELEISVDVSIIGKYGAHSEVSLDAKASYDSSRPVGDVPGLWICGHFTGKSFALLLKLLQEDIIKKRQKRVLVFWQTKSAVQPLGSKDEWKAFSEECAANSAFKKWGVLGGISGHPRAPASLVEAKSAPAAGPDQYRCLMTAVH